jgi:hypothetical protein
MIVATVRLSGFSLEVLDALAPSPQWPAEETVERALEGYLADRALRPPGWACLPLPEGSAPRSGADRPALEVELPAESREDAAAEAAAQGVSVEALVVHAVTYLWASEHRADGEPAPVSKRSRES